MVTGQERPRSNRPGQVNFDVGQVKNKHFVVKWVSEISLSSPVSLFESVSLVNDNNFQTDYFKTEYRKMSDTITKLLVESMNQVHFAHSCYCCDHNIGQI